MKLPTPYELAALEAECDTITAFEDGCRAAYAVVERALREKSTGHDYADRVCKEIADAIRKAMEEK